jgi:hypothetical protein
MLEKIGDSFVFYNRNHDLILREYYLYCVSIFKEALLELDVKYNFLFGKYDYKFNNSNKVIRVDIQCEHTLVKPGGRGSDGSPIGRISCGKGKYLVRLANQDYLNSLDIVVEYSNPNIVNLRSCGLFDEYLSKNVYIAPLIYDNPLLPKKRNGKVISSFINPNEKRRKKILDEARHKNVIIENVQGIFAKEDLRSLYSDSSILINVHQTDHHHTFEEIRVLSAIMNGCLVVSEDVPLKDCIPYSDFIIWADYDKLIDKVKYAQDNYQSIWSSIFESQRYLTVVNNMKKVNQKNVLERIKSL